MGANAAPAPADTWRPPSPAALLRTLLRLQALAFFRAPHVRGRTVLAVLKGLGLVYAVATAAALGFLLPDTLSVWAPGVSALRVVGAAVLPALGLLTVGRVLFQDVPARGAEAFLMLPVSRDRIARAVAVRSALTVFNAAPLAFAVPFALRTVRVEAGTGAAVGFVVGIAALVAVSHVAVVVWKTRLGAAPAQTVVVVFGALGAAAGLAVMTGGPLGAHAGLGAALVVPVALALGAFAHRSLADALFLDPGASPRRRAGRARDAGFEQPGAWAFVALGARLVARARYPRGIVLNAVATTAAVASYAFGWASEAHVALLLVVSTGTIAVSAGQFALPFASGHYDRLLTLPGAPRAFVRATLAMTVGSTVALGALQLAAALVVAPHAWPDVAGAVLFCGGVLAPVAVLGSTLAPKPLDVADRFMTSSRVQSLPPQIALAAAVSVAAALFAGLGPDLGLAATAAVGALGALGLPLWARAIEARVVGQRHAVAGRFRSVL